MSISKHLLLGLSICLLTSSLKAQDDSSETSSERNNFYLSISSGIDNYTGILGVGAVIPFSDQVGLRIGAGIGSWGGKISAGLKFQDLTKSGVGFGLGYSSCSGLQDFDLTFEDQSGGSRVVNMDFNRVGSLNFTINKNFLLKEGMLLYIESGYAVATGGTDFYTINDGSTLDDDEELILNIIRPGGLILSLGLLIGL